MTARFGGAIALIPAVVLAAAPLGAQRIGTPAVGSTPPSIVRTSGDAPVPLPPMSAVPATIPTESAIGVNRLIRLGKWTLLGVAVGFGAYAVVHSQRADRRYGELRRLCGADPLRCQTRGDGQYVDDEAEDIYRSAVAEDRDAQVGIIWGQVSLLGSVALFIADLRNDRGPDDIPYPTNRRLVGIGLRLSH